MRALKLLRLSNRLSRDLYSIASSSSSSFSSLRSVRNLSILSISSPPSSSSSNFRSSPGHHLTFSDSLDGTPWSAVQRRGVKVNAIHLKPGNVIEKSGRIYQVVEAEHKQQGRGGAMMQLELRDVDSGSKQSLRFGTEDAVERVYVEEKSMTCLYTEHDVVYLMDPENFEQLEVPIDMFSKAAAYLKEEMTVKLQLYDGRPLSGSVPKKVTCSIKEIQTNPKGTTVTPRYLKALLDNGLTVQVPAYLEAGEEIVVNTDDNSYVSRANK